MAGTAGMSLATVIRLEFAYPGVGILAGDSLQYLSTATAHGVIMVFYMIMPAIFGAFGNFLLPTQLGVHDVAFPRLNSAAFWFLPGGLIMLCQLVCTDRRYARMNCFNIRELQGILKRKFFVDLINSHDHRNILEESMLGIRYKNNQTLNLDLDYNIFYNFGLHTLQSTGHTTYNVNNKSGTIKNRVFIDKVSCNILNTLNLSNFSEDFFTKFAINLISNVNLKFYNVLLDFFLTPLYINVLNFSSIFNKNLLFSAFVNNLLFFYEAPSYKIITDYQHTLNTKTSHIFSKNTILRDESSHNAFSESSSKQRYLRFSNPLINYDYKTGNYIGN